MTLRFVFPRPVVRRCATGLSLLGVMALAHAALISPTAACPFCSAVSQTFSEEMQTMDVVAFAELVAAPPPESFNANDPGAELPKAKFRIVEILKGETWARVGQIVEPFYFGEAAKDRPFLLMGSDVPNVMWSTPLIFNERSRAYLRQLSHQPQPKTGVEAAGDPANAKLWARRLEFFQDYLEDQDEMLARDAYDEFAKAPYAAVQAMRAHLKHDQLMKWIHDPDVPNNRRRLYFTMLGVCATPDDAPALASLMASQDRKDKAGLDALIACYMLIAKDAGLARVDELFLKNRDAEYADTYAAIMAIRFHGSEVDAIPQSRLVKSLRLMLQRPELADLVIPDLARWKDWEIMPELVRLFKESDENSSWVRVPVINYLRVCPLPEAAAYIEELAKIDPEAVKRAKTFFPISSEPAAGKSPSSTSGDDAAEKVKQGVRSTSTPASLPGGAPDGPVLDEPRVASGGPHPAAIADQAPDDAPMRLAPSGPIALAAYQIEATVGQLVSSAGAGPLTALATDSLALVPISALTRADADSPTPTGLAAIPPGDGRVPDPEQRPAAMGRTRPIAAASTKLNAGQATPADRPETWQVRVPNRLVLACVTTSIAIGLFWLQRTILGYRRR